MPLGVIRERAHRPSLAAPVGGRVRGARVACGPAERSIRGGAAEAFGHERIVGASLVSVGPAMRVLATGRVQTGYCSRGAGGRELEVEGPGLACRYCVQLKILGVLLWVEVWVGLLLVARDVTVLAVELIRVGVRVVVAVVEVDLIGVGVLVVDAVVIGLAYVELLGVRHGGQVRGLASPEWPTFGLARKDCKRGEAEDANERNAQQHEPLRAQAA
mmetsp:Transcript_9032/g.23604  ORF Transcript_9032/g.23604 Transcript_9032/m.23604 type:complete len:216 (-) Transcript_9032:160-807(-)